ARADRAAARSQSGLRGWARAPPRGAPAGPRPARRTNRARRATPNRSRPRAPAAPRAPRRRPRSRSPAAARSPAPAPPPPPRPPAATLHRRPRPQVLRGEQEAHVIGGAGRFDLLTQPVEHAAVDAREQPAIAPLQLVGVFGAGELGGHEAPAQHVALHLDARE